MARRKLHNLKLSYLNVSVIEWFIQRCSKLHCLLLCRRLQVEHAFGSFERWQEDTYRELDLHVTHYDLCIGVCVCNLNWNLLEFFAPANRWGIEFECLLRKAWLKLLALLSPNNREISCLRTVRTGSAASLASDTVDKRDNDIDIKDNQIRENC